MQYRRPHQALRDPPRAPIVSVLMASYRPGVHVRRALGSVLAQTIGDIEVIVVDDGSDDGSVEIIEAVKARDDRVRLLRSSRNGGPAHARNLALDVAAGSWLAVVDADDILHPQRFERLIAAAGQLGADIVADDIMQFYEDGSPVELLLEDGVTQPMPISAVDWILGGVPPRPALGYLKPVFRAGLLEGRRYDETLRIGEDYDFVLRLLLGGASAWVVPEPWYLYRKHARSASHRSSIADRTALIAAQNRIMERAEPMSSPVRDAFERRMRLLQAGLGLDRLVAAIKSGDLAAALRILGEDPRQAARLVAAFSRGQLRRRNGRPGDLQGAGGSVKLHLSDRPGTTRRPDGTAVVSVPPLEPSGIPLEGWRHRHVWRDLANRSRGRRVEITYDGPAGLYAAGFIPQDEDPLSEPPAAGVERFAEGVDQR